MFSRELFINLDPNFLCFPSGNFSVRTSYIGLLSYLTKIKALHVCSREKKLIVILDCREEGQSVHALKCI